MCVCGGGGRGVLCVCICVCVGGGGIVCMYLCVCMYVYVCVLAWFQNRTVDLPYLRMLPPPVTLSVTMQSASLPNSNWDHFGNDYIV